MSHETNPQGPQNEFFLKKKPVIAFAVNKLTILAAPDIKAANKENLAKTLELAKGKSLIFISNHLSNLDAPAFERALRKIGHPEIAAKLIFIQGIKLDRNPAAKLFLPAFNRIQVWPPTLGAATEEEKAERMSKTRSSLKNSKKALENGYALTIFPEGGRSYDGQLKKAEPAIITYLTLQPGTIVQPVAIMGTQKVLPPGSPMFNPLKSKVSISFGKPIAISFLMEELRNLPHREKREKAADHIMQKIAEMLPQENRGYYK